MFKRILEFLTLRWLWDRRRTTTSCQGHPWGLARMRLTASSIEKHNHAIYVAGSSTTVASARKFGADRTAARGRRMSDEAQRAVSSRRICWGQT
jgi:hypothetical protein